ncbi:hypothetical protein NDU88_006905 [Pleurodeles waltl]|uniref:Uncharacterized protein n=1 Tax=Pleurodeles waltl TaxID=8319 RepID=A0AAV7SR14_PLEWA|nr:hypothetical protein NDU88_006905 [Pleurodeles waltl]
MGVYQRCPARTIKGPRAPHISVYPPVPSIVGSEESTASLSSTDSCRVRAPNQETRDEQSRSLTPTAGRCITDPIRHSLKDASRQLLQADLGRAPVHSSPKCGECSRCPHSRDVRISIYSKGTT